MLSALPEQWQEFMKQTPVAPYQSYWGESVDAPFVAVLIHPASY